MQREFYGANMSPITPKEVPDAPMSPGKKLLYYAGSPGRFIKK
jgi:hypothetical protein